jgi:alkanesulfonate monooxygenase SsuD/methylene tetrahydromethanopterin reductase-like flavin-dependent oxidoreductase (luciferase family)
VFEVNNDVLATVELMGEATQGIQVGSWVANIYLRHPYVCAQAAALIVDSTGGRMLLGDRRRHARSREAS